jgi:uncharacterized protein YydD (DUF2326 family)
MIRSVKANRRGFRDIRFTQGVNLILADRSKAAGDKDTTNALGKSTLIDIVDFCLGSNTAPGKGLRIEALQGWAFTLELTVGGNDVAATRATDAPGFFAIEGSTDGWPIQPTANKEGTPGLDLKRWRAVIAWAIFSLTLQLPFRFEVRALSDRLVSSTPE